MFCIAAFIILLVLGIFSAKYRTYLGKAWSCTLHRVTFRPCDTTFKQDMKDKLLAPIAVRKPGLVRPASIGLEVISVVVILTTVWSAYTVVKSGLNLFVYGTCNKENSESCTLGAEACSVGDATPGFLDSLATFDVVGAFGNEFGSLGETITAIPSRLREWKAEEYLPQNASYLTAYSSDKPTAVEIIDPGCRFCRKLFENIEEANFADSYNLSYIAFPIATDSEYKFPNSLLATQYLEALRIAPPTTGEETPLDWRILARLFTEENDKGVSYQDVLNGYSHEKAVAMLDGWLAEFGLSDAQLAEVKKTAASDRVADIIAANRVLVKDRIDTVKIPTIIFDGRRHDGVVSVDDLH